MERIENKSFDQERALYGSDGLEIVNCAFSGPADGESAIKECRNIEVRDSLFNLRYPMWHVDNLIVDKLTYHFKDPERFDIIVFPYKYEENTYYIKRIIGMPGETIQIIGGYVYINGQQLTSDIYGTEVMASAGIAAEPITLGADEYFVLGDNRNHSTDSREPNVGVLHREDLLGRAWVRIYPFDKIGVIQHE